MSKVTLKGTPITIDGNFPKLHERVANFTLTKNDLSDVSLDNFSHKFLILNIFPSLDTPVCSASMHHFNQSAADLPDCAILCISKDLPFAFSRFCESNNVKSVTTLSAFRSTNFAKDFGVNIADGPMRGLLARAVVILNDMRSVIYTQMVSEITHGPDYDKALSAIANYD